MLLKKVICDHSEIKEVSSVWIRVRNNFRSIILLPKPSFASTNTMAIKSTRRCCRASASGTPFTTWSANAVSIDVSNCWRKRWRWSASLNGESSARSSRKRRWREVARNGGKWRHKLRFFSKFFSKIDHRIIIFKTYTKTPLFILSPQTNPNLHLPPPQNNVLPIFAIEKKAYKFKGKRIRTDCCEQIRMETMNVRIIARLFWRSRQ